MKQNFVGVFVFYEMIVKESFLQSTHGQLEGLDQLPTHSFKHIVERELLYYCGCVNDAGDKFSSFSALCLD